MPEIFERVPTPGIVSAGLVLVGLMGSEETGAAGFTSVDGNSGLGAGSTGFVSLSGVSGVGLTVCLSGETGCLTLEAVFFSPEFRALFTSQTAMPRTTSAQTVSYTHLTLPTS